MKLGVLMNPLDIPVKVNGKEVIDIELVGSNKDGNIRWRQGGFVLEVIENDFENAGYYSISALYTDTEADVEVIGNIHDNPELIKEENK